MSVLEPHPAQVGFMRVISKRVQFSPLVLQPPVCKYPIPEKGPLLVYSSPVRTFCPLSMSTGDP